MPIRFPLELDNARRQETHEYSAIIWAFATTRRRFNARHSIPGIQARHAPVARQPCHQGRSRRQHFETARSNVLAAREPMTGKQRLASAALATSTRSLRKPKPRVEPDPLASDAHINGRRDLLQPGQVFALRGWPWSSASHGMFSSATEILRQRISGRRSRAHVVRVAGARLQCDAVSIGVRRPPALVVSERSAPGAGGRPRLSVSKRCDDRALGLQPA